MRARPARRLRAERGMSLVEATVVLLTLSALTAVIAPSIGGYIEDGKQIKATTDVETIGAAITSVLHDTGMLCLSLAGANCANTATGRVELLVSGTAVGSKEPAVLATTAGAVTASTASASTLNWGGGANEVADARRDLMDRQFVTNGAGYTSVSFTAGGGPRTGIGWRGAYVDGPVDIDPWGYSYQASTVFLVTAPDAVDGTANGQRRGGWANDVVVISAGSNGTLQTPFGSTGGTAIGDDVMYVVQGSTH
jgi:type II secretory pathway pseudopilin PulG